MIKKKRREKKEKRFKSKGKRKSQKRKNPIYVKKVVENAKREIEVWESRLDSGEISAAEVKRVEDRICTLMNVTIPNAKEGLVKKNLL